MLSNDTSVLPPPIAGPFPFNTFYPVLGVPYLDPVFGAVNPQGSTVLRITDVVGDKLHNWSEGIYGHHWLNADGTYAFFTQGGVSSVHGVIKVSDQSVVRSPVSWPGSGLGADVSWHPTDPNSFYYPSGSDIRKYNVAAGTSAPVNSAGKFPSALETCGGSLDFVDATGTKFVVQYGGAGHVYDSVSDTIYSGTGPGAPGSGYWCMAANAAYAFFVSGGLFNAYPLNHVTHTIGAAFPFWNDLGDHAGFACASNGKVYMLRQDRAVDDFFYIVEVKDETGRTNAQMRTDNVQLFHNGSLDDHVSGVGRGAFQDWIFMNMENLSGTFNDGVVGWGVYQDEILAINVITHEIRRLAHHRSRSISSFYEYQPKVSCSWDGSCIAFLSNYNYQGTDACDMFAIQNPLGAAGGGGSLPDPDDGGGWFSQEPQTNPVVVSTWG